MRRQTEESATVTFRTESGKELIASALLQRDPHFLNWNRILILGSEDVMIQAMVLQGHGPVHWEIHNRPDWPGASEIKRHRSGSGFMRTTGMTQGVSIAENSIQAVAELAIYEQVDQFQNTSEGQQSAEFWFLQRSRHWPVNINPFRRNDGRRLFDRWIPIGSANLRFRLISTTHLRDDERISREVERLVIPGVEIEPIRKNDDPEFGAKATALWFTLRVLLTFGLRQYIYPLAEHIGSRDASTSTWHAVELEPRQPKSDASDTHHPHLFEVLPNASRQLFRLGGHQELMHAAAYGYASSFDTLTLEAGLTNCVQAIERLVSAFEAVSSLDADVVDRRAWKPIAKSLKDHVGTLRLKSPIQARVKRALSAPIKLSLQDRIERMAHAYRRRLPSTSAKLLNGIDKMIKTRNDIVHGRLISDGNVTYVEQLRAQALFEQLFLCFLGCGRASTSASYASSQIARHYEPNARRPAPPPSGNSA